MESNIELEQHFFYRLIKFIYSISLVFFSLCALMIGFYLMQLQHKIVDQSSSYLICDNGKIIPFQNFKYPNDLRVDFTFYGPILFYESDTLAKQACAGELSSMNTSDSQVVQSPNYKLEVNAKYLELEQNDLIVIWILTGIWWVLSLSIIYLILNIFREMFVYLIYGKKISWSWLRRIRFF